MEQDLRSERLKEEATSAIAYVTNKNKYYPFNRERTAQGLRFWVDGTANGESAGALAKGLIIEMSRCFAVYDKDVSKMIACQRRKGKAPHLTLLRAVQLWRAQTGTWSTPEVRSKCLDALERSMGGQV